MNNKQLLLYISKVGLAIALVFISTVLLRVDIGMSKPNLGDSFIFITSFFLGPIAGLISGAIGSCLADLIIYPTTALFTLVIKGIEGLISGLLFIAFKKFMINTKRTYLFIILITFISSLFMIGGYFISKAFLYGTMEGALYSLITNSIQGGCNIILTCLLFLIIKKSHLEKYLMIE